MPTNETEREMVRVLAERIFGWTYWDGEQDYDGPDGVTIFTDWGCDDLGRVDVYENGSDDVTRTFSPFRNWADAGMLLEALHKQKVLGTVRSLYDTETEPMGIWWVATLTWRDFQFHQRDAESGPRAISLAAYEWAEAKKEQR